MNAREIIKWVKKQKIDTSKATPHKTLANPRKIWYNVNMNKQISLSVWTISCYKYELVSTVECKIPLTQGSVKAAATLTSKSLKT